MTRRPTRTEGEPHDDLTRLGNAMLALLDDHPGVKAIVMLNDADERGGIALRGYQEDTEAMVDMFVHLRAIFEANGKTLLIGSVQGKG